MVNSAQSDAFLAALHPIAALSMNVAPHLAIVFTFWALTTLIAKKNRWHLFAQPSLPVHLDASPKDEDTLMVQLCLLPFNQSTAVLNETFWIIIEPWINASQQSNPVAFSSSGNMVFSGRFRRQWKRSRFRRSAIWRQSPWWSSHYAWCLIRKTFRTVTE